MVEIAATRPLPFNYRKMVDATFAVFIFCGAIALVEPSPYDFASLITIPLWFFGGFRLTRALIPFLILIFFYNMGGFISLVPYWHEADPTMFMYQSLYLALTCIFFALYFSDHTVERAQLCLNAFTASTLLAATAGILGYFDIIGLGSIFAMYGRASGTFKDPNVLGSYLIMGALALMQLLYLGKTRRPILTGLGLAWLTAGILLSFSRGSWGAFIVGAGLLTYLTRHTADTPQMRKRVGWIVIVVVALSIIVMLGLLSVPDIREFFLQRAAATQDYDVGETGRFGNQARSIPMLPGLPNGMGPLRFRLIFGLEPHSSYINSFASYGWIGGLSFFLLVGITTFIGFRLCLKPSPFRRSAQVVWPSLFVLLLQGWQIDIDHWRHVYLMFGAVWGMEAARSLWQARENRRLTKNLERDDIKWKHSMSQSPS